MLVFFRRRAATDFLSIYRNIDINAQCVIEAIDDENLFVDAPKQICIIILLVTFYFLN